MNQFLCQWIQGFDLSKVSMEVFLTNLNYLSYGMLIEARMEKIALNTSNYYFKNVEKLLIKNFTWLWMVIKLTTQ